MTATRDSKADGKPCVAQGRVSSTSRCGAAGLFVEIVDRDVGDDVRVGSALTDESGRYHAQLTAPVKAPPDLQARVWTSDSDTAELLGESAVSYAAPEIVVLDVMLPEASPGLENEYDLLTRSLGSRFEGRLADIEESERRQDVTYLANKTGWDARAVALAVVSRRLAEETDDAIAPPLYYALLRAGLPASSDALFRTSPAAVEGVWRRAIEEGVVAPTMADVLPAARSAFEELAVQRALTTVPSGSVSSLDTLLDLTFPDDSQSKQTFAQLQVQAGRDDATLWQSVESTFGGETRRRLQVDGQLASLTLNNAPLVGAVHAAEDGSAGGPLEDPAELVSRGYFRSARWLDLLPDHVPDPIPGATAEEKRANYADFLAAQVRVSFPTAVVAARLADGDLLSGTASEVREGVSSFLVDHAGRFELGAEPVEAFVSRNDDVASPDDLRVLGEIKRIQRVYQLTPHDEALGVLLDNGLDSAFQIADLDETEFVAARAADLDVTDAKAIHARSRQVSNAVLNIATTFLTTRAVPALGARADEPILGTLVDADAAQAAAAGVIAYPTLEGLFGSMNVGACDQCGSVLSPAAYLVDLLKFVDNSLGSPNPLTVLLARRPDLGELPLTCENTNTVVPHIDLVNETLEHFVAHSLSLQGFAGHDTLEGLTPDESLASPQNVDETAYATLAAELFPPPLPFHRPLVTLRQLFERMGVPLATAMATLRPGDDVDATGDAPYGWRDILMEQVGLSRTEHRILTDRTLTLQQLFGYPAATTVGDVVTELSQVRTWATRLGLTYDEVARVLTTRFVNPSVSFVPRLARLRVSFEDLKRLKDGGLTVAEFNAMLPDDLDPTAYGGDVSAWVRDEENYAGIMRLIIPAAADSSAPTAAGSGLDGSGFDERLLRFADPDTSHQQLRSVELVRLIRFVRLRAKLGWTIEQTDSAIAALLPETDAGHGAEAAQLERLDEGFKRLVLRLGVVMSLMRRLKIEPTDGLFEVLSYWSVIDTYRVDAPYRRLFPRSSATAEGVFADNGYGEVLTDPDTHLLTHADALQAAFGLKAEEFKMIVGDLGLGLVAKTKLDLENVSAVHRRAGLARTLGLGVRDLVLFSRATGIDPFSDPEPPAPGLVHLLDLLDAMDEVNLSPEAALELLWAGSSADPQAEARSLLALLREIRGRLVAVDADLMVDETATADKILALLGLRFSGPAAELLASVLSGSVAVDVPYDVEGLSALPKNVVEASGSRLVFDQARKRLSYAGAMSSDVRDSLRTAGSSLAGFGEAIDTLFQASKDRVAGDPAFALTDAAIADFLTENPDVEESLLHFATASAPTSARRAAFVSSVLKDVAAQRRQAETLLGAALATGTEPALAEAVLTDVRVLRAPHPTPRTALDTLVAPGLGLEDVDQEEIGAAQTWVFGGYLDVREGADYLLRVDAHESAEVTLSIDGSDVEMVTASRARTTTKSQMWETDRLVSLTVTVETADVAVTGPVRTPPILTWKQSDQGWQVVPEVQVFGRTAVDDAAFVHTRYLKAAAIAAALGLSPIELAHVASDAGMEIDGAGWLNAVPTPADEPGASRLLVVLEALVEFARLKQDISVPDDVLVQLLKDPSSSGAGSTPASLALVGWDSQSLKEMLKRLDLTPSDLDRVENLRKVFDALSLVSSLGMSVASAGLATTNDPDSGAVQTVQSALRARHGSAWFEVLKSVNDPLRQRRRDALVAFILRELRARPETAHVDTPDKLFEFFLMDVQMEPCAQTSRVRHAISGVQLFVERVLMNLDSEVSPGSVNRGRWEWMKRYRLWEANRQAFLWPENWLEPELRHNQSPAFRQTMSELLQSDITEDSAASALLGYLSSLEEVAKLEPCAIHYVEGEEERGDEIAHVIARTAGAQRKYYYRQRAFTAWTPWEPITLDIEDNPITPVLWKGRLLLFWLKILKGNPPMQPAPDGTGSTPLGQLTVGEAQSGAMQNVMIAPQAVLCWSEYYNNRWQPTKTSNVSIPTGFGRPFDVAGQGAFNRDLLSLGETLEGDALVVRIWGQGSGSSFTLYNTHSLPQRQEDRVRAPVDIKDFAELVREFDTQTETLKIAYSGGAEEGAYRPVLTKKDGAGYRITSPHPVGYIPGELQQGLLRDPWHAPFFYNDGRHTFFVTTPPPDASVVDRTSFGVVQPEPVPVDIAPLVGRGTVDGSGELLVSSGLTRVDSTTGVRQREPLAVDAANLHTLIDTSVNLLVGDTEIAPQGVLRRSRGDAGKEASHDG